MTRPRWFILAIAVLLVIGSFSNSPIAGEAPVPADAQGTETWQAKHFSDPYSDDAERSFIGWIETMPTDCDIETLGQGALELIVYYRCP